MRSKFFEKIKIFDMDLYIQIINQLQLLDINGPSKGFFMIGVIIAFLKNVGKVPEDNE